MAGPLRVAVLVSGEGSTLEALAQRWSRAGTPVRIVLVISDRHRAHAVDRARALDLPLAIVARDGMPLDRWAEELTRRLREAGAELILLAGFLAILPASWVTAWEGRAINLHPALLPRHGGRGMYGARVHEAVLRAHETETGATVHLVTADVDRGPILAQATLPVLSEDTPESLRARLHPVEVELLHETVLRFARGDLPLPYR